MKKPEPPASDIPIKLLEIALTMGLWIFGISINILLGLFLWFILLPYIFGPI
jgi:hypothetical protein